MRSSALQLQIKSQLFIIANQGIVAVLHPIFSAIFTRLTGIQQTAFVLFMPMIKFFAKQNIANAAENCHEYVGPIVVFSVDLFNVYYVAICMQTSKSVGTTLIIMAADSFHLLLALRSMLRHANDSVVNGGQFFSSILERVNSIPHGANSHQSPIRQVRLFAPFPLPISRESKILMSEFEKTDIFSNDKSANRRCSSTVKTANFESKEGPALSRQPTSLGSSVKQTQILPFVSDDLQAAASLNSSAHATAQRASSSSKEKEIGSVLQSLFHSEYVLLAEYIEFMVPLLYAPYLVAIFHLPVAAYYPNTASTDEAKLKTTVANILLYAGIEVAAFAALLVILWRKFGFSPLHQLAFVLEMQASALQGHLFLWTITILHLTLAHYGVDFNDQIS